MANQFTPKLLELAAIETPETTDFCLFCGEPGERK